MEEEEEEEEGGEKECAARGTGSAVVGEDWSRGGGVGWLGPGA